MFAVQLQEEEETQKMNSVTKAIEFWMALKKRTEEIDLRLEPSGELQGWQESDHSEWTKIADSGAIQVLSVEESMLVRKQLEMQGRLNRILPSRFMRKYKRSRSNQECLR